MQSATHIKYLDVERDILDALVEADILECALDNYNANHVVIIASKLCGAPIAQVRNVYDEQKERACQIKL